MNLVLLRGKVDHIRLIPDGNDEQWSREKGR